ncbi:MAG: phosphotransferase [Pseudomonadota bacterium]
MQIPDGQEDITVEWIRECLPQGLEAISVTPIGEGVGIFGRLYQVSLSWDGDDNGRPASVIVKLPCPESENRAVAQALRLYEREVMFFKEVAPHTALRTPHCYAAELQDQIFVIVMEDLSKHLMPGDQIVGANYQQAEAFIDSLVELHATWWQDDRLAALEWMPCIDAPDNLASVPGIFHSCVEPLESWRARLPAGSIELCRRLDPHFETLMRALGTGPTSVAHGDARWDNVFFSDTSPMEIGLIDFQICFRAKGVHDMAYFICSSLQLEEHPRWQSLLQHWYDGIMARGIEYDWQDCVKHYKQSALYTLAAPLSMVGLFDTGNERGSEMLRVYLERIFRHLLDIGVEDVLAELE